MRTKEEAINWAYQQVGKPEPLPWGGWSQCVAFVRNFVAFLGCKQPPGVPSAKELWRVDWGPDFVKVGTPQPGDIGILNSIATNPSGHINIVVRLEPGRIVTVDQNLVHPLLKGTQGSPPAQVSWVWPSSRFLGFVRPLYKIDPIVTSTIGKGGDEPMPEVKLTPSQVDKAIKMSLGREPTQEELNNPDYANSAGLLIETLWNNGGAQRYNDKGLPPATARQLAAEQMLDTMETALNFR